MSIQWIGGIEESYTVGQVGFLIEYSNPVSRTKRWVLRDNPAQTNKRWVLRDNPAQTNQSLEPRLYGWCGAYNDTNTNAHGMARVVRVARNGRAQIVKLKNEEIPAALDDLGYPELAPAN